MAELAPKQTKEKLRSVKRESRVVKRKYISQSLDFMTIFNSIMPTNLTGLVRADYIAMFAVIDRATDGYNQDITNTLKSSEDSLIDLAVDHTSEHAAIKGITFELSSVFNKIQSRKLENIGNFQLSGAIWGDDKRTRAYAEVIKGIQNGKTKSEISGMLEQYLIGSNNSGNLYNVNRVTTTEFNRAYFQSSIDSTRAYNEDATDLLLYERRLSPAHKVTDICDELVGVYDTRSVVPEIPSHPNCQCLISRKFMSDYKGKLKTLDLQPSGLYQSTKFKQTNVML